MATCSTSKGNNKDGQPHFICLGQQENLGESCFAVDGSLSSHIRAVQHFVTALWSLKERSVRDETHQKRKAPL